MCLDFVSSSISFSISPLIWSDMVSLFLDDFLSRNENILSFNLTFRLFGFGSDVVLVEITPFVIVGQIKLLAVVRWTKRGSWRLSHRPLRRPFIWHPAVKNPLCNLLLKYHG